MCKQTLSLAILVLAAPAAAMATPSVAVTLSATQDGQIVPPGATIEWAMTFSVSQGDNEGLALLSCDLVQDPGNPAYLDIPPADGVPAAMTNFSRPAGVSNPGETDPNTGYSGVQRGPAGAMDLWQVGGGQNTFGEALPPGSGIGENEYVVGGVGQGTPQILASGSFAAPTTVGAYTFQLVNVLGNVLVQVNTPPDFSPVTAATIDVSGGSIDFTVTLVGDVDLDCDVDLADLAQLLGNYNTTSGMTWAEGDLDGDGAVGIADLASLLGNYGDTCP